MAATDLTAERVKEVFNYDPETGEFYRKLDKYGRHITPYKVGFTMSNGYTYLSIDGKQVRAHRIAWLYVTEQWPDLFVDHINGDKSDNRFCNLRVATPRINAENRRAPKTTSTTGHMGVSQERSVWRATITTNKKFRRIGTFKTPQEAHDAYLKAKRAEHPGCTI